MNLLFGGYFYDKHGKSLCCGIEISDLEKTFEGCVGKNKLRYDYYLQLNGKEYCIETDGLQHEIPIDKFGGIKEFEKRKRYDEIKNNYCKDNNIELIRIKQKEYKDMENIIVERLGLIGEVVKTV